MKALTLLSLIGLVVGYEHTLVGESAAPASCVCAPMMIATNIKDADYSAQPNEHVLVNFNTAQPGDLVIGLPYPNQYEPGSRVRVTDLSADGGVGNGAALRIVGTFAQIPGGHYATSGYVVANDGQGNSRRGANIELVDNGDGWLIVAESCQP